jgi:phosphomannomutase
LQRKAGKKLNVGRDVRLSSDRLRDALVKGLMAAAVKSPTSAKVPTPLLYYSVHHLKANGGVHDHGSHNPAEYNGFKVVSAPAPFMATTSRRFTA